MAATHNVSRPPPWSAAAELAKLVPWTLCVGASAALRPLLDQHQAVKESSSRGAVGGGLAALGFPTLDYSTPRLSNT